MARALKIRDAVEAKVIPLERGMYGVSYRTSSGCEGKVPVGPRSQAEAMVRRLKLRRDNTPSLAPDEINPFPKDVAAS
jgi:hypothetical protein